MKHLVSSIIIQSGSLFLMGHWPGFPIFLTKAIYQNLGKLASTPPSPHPNFLTDIDYQIDHLKTQPWVNSTLR